MRSQINRQKLPQRTQSNGSLPNDIYAKALPMEDSGLLSKGLRSKCVLTQDQSGSGTFFIFEKGTDALS